MTHPKWEQKTYVLARHFATSRSTEGHYSNMERKRQQPHLPPGCAWPRMLGTDQAAAGVLTHAATDHNQLNRKEEAAARRNPDAEEGMETLWFRTALFREDDSYTLHYNSFQQVETVSNFLAFKTFQTGHEDANSDVLKGWVSHTGHRRLAPLPHKSGWWINSRILSNSCCIVSAKTSTVHFLSVVHFSCLEAR